MVDDKQKCLPIMYWLPKMHKSPIDEIFIVAPKNCSIKPITIAVSWVLKCYSSLCWIPSLHASFIQITTNFGLYKTTFLLLKSWKRSMTEGKIFLHLTSEPCTPLFPIIFSFKFLLKSLNSSSNVVQGTNWIFWGNTNVIYQTMNRWCFIPHNQLFFHC